MWSLISKRPLYSDNLYMGCLTKFPSQHQDGSTHKHVLAHVFRVLAKMNLSHSVWRLCTLIGNCVVSEN